MVCSRCLLVPNLFQQRFIPHLYFFSILDCPSPSYPTRSGSRFQTTFAEHKRPTPSSAPPDLHVSLTRVISRSGHIYVYHGSHKIRVFGPAKAETWLSTSFFNDCHRKRSQRRRTCRCRPRKNDGSKITFPPWWLCCLLGNCSKRAGFYES